MRNLPVAHALVRAASPLMATPVLRPEGVEMSLDTARTSACATLAPRVRHAGYLLASAVLLSAACTSAPPGAVDVTARKVTLPDGVVTMAEVKITPEQQAQGMMYRTELAH